MMRTILITEEKSQDRPRDSALIWVGVAPSASLFERAGFVKDECKEGDVIMIDITLPFSELEQSLPAEKGGIALLKFLRILGVKNHIVLLSPWRLDELLRMGAGSHIVGSKGVTVVPYTFSPDDVRSYDGQSIESLSQDTAPSDAELRPYFKAGISLPKDEKHDWANWWGIFKLVEEVRHFKGGPDMSTPDALANRLEDLNSAELRYVYNASERLLANTGPAFPFLRCARVLLVDDQADDGWAHVLRQLFSGCKSRTEPVVKTVVPSPGDLKDPRACELFYSGHLVAPLTGVGEDDFQADLLILDLRLDPVSDASGSSEPEELSGVRLLSVIREHHPGIPIMAFTASRDPQVHATLLEYGADRIWMKPALDVSDPSSRGPRSAKALIEAINILGNYDHELLDRYGEFYRRVRDGEGSFWWSNHVFESGDGTTYDTSTSFSHPTQMQGLIGSINAGLMDYRSLLQRYGGMTTRDNIPFALRMASLIGRLALLVDAIHTGGRRPTGYPNIVYDVKDPSASRKDLMGWLLLCFGQQASQFSFARMTRPKHLRMFMDVLLDYLDCSDFPVASAGHFPLAEVSGLVWKRSWWYMKEDAANPPSDTVVASYVLGKDLVDHVKVILKKD